MPLGERLEYLISADGTAAVSTVRGLASEFDRSLGNVESRLSRTASAMTKFGAGGIGVGGFLTSIASGDIEAANQLQAAITQTGHTVDEYRGRIDEAVAAQVQFGHTDEEVSNALNTLVGSYGDTNKALDEMQLVADLAAKKHIGLGEAATIVAKAHGGAARVFKEFNIDVQTNADGTKNYDAALGVLSQKLTGQASAAADSWGGKLRELRAEIENDVSAFGQEFGPAILITSTALTAAGTVASGVSAIHGRLALAHGATAAAAEAQAAAETELAASELLVTTNSSAAVASLYAQDTALIGSSAAFGAWGIAAAAAIIGVSEAADILGSKVEHTFREDVSNALHQTGDEIKSVFTSIIFEGNREDPGKFLTGLENAGTAGLGALIKLRDSLRATGQDTTAVDQAIAEATAGQDQYASAVDTGTRALGGEDAATKKLEQTQRSLLSSTRAAFDAQRSYEQAQRSVQSALSAVADAEDRVADARERLAEAQQGASPEDAEKAHLDLSDAQNRAGDSAKTLADEQTRLDKVRAKGIATSDEMAAEERKVAELANQHERDTLSVHDAEKALQDLQKKGTDQDKAVIDAKKALKDANDGVASASQGVRDAYVNEADAQARLLDATNSLKDGGLSNRDAINDQIYAYALLKNQLDPNSPLRKNIEDYTNDLLLLRALTSSSSDALVEFLTGNPADIQRQFAQGETYSHRAMGGLVSAGQVYRVGEHGEEWFRPWQSGFIDSHSAVRAAQAGGSSQPIVQISQVVREDVADDAFRGVNRALILDRR